MEDKKKSRRITNEVPQEIGELSENEFGIVGVIHNMISHPLPLPLYILAEFILFLLYCFLGLLILGMFYNLHLPFWYAYVILLIMFLFYRFVRGIIESLIRSNIWLVLNVGSELPEEKFEKMWNKWNELNWRKKLRVKKFLKNHLQDLSQEKNLN